MFDSLQDVFTRMESVYRLFTEILLRRTQASHFGFVVQFIRKSRKHSVYLSVLLRVDLKQEGERKRMHFKIEQDLSCLYEKQVAAEGYICSVCVCVW